MVPTDEADEFYQVMKKLVFIVLAIGPSFFSGNNLGVNCFIVYFLIRKKTKSHCIKRAKTESLYTGCVSEKSVMLAKST